MICDETEVVDPKKIASGSIWTIMPQMKNSASCKTTYALDSNPNTLSVLYLIPQYIVITISEVLNSVTGMCSHCELHSPKFLYLPCFEKYSYNL